MEATYQDVVEIPMKVVHEIERGDVRAELEHVADAGSHGGHSGAERGEGEEKDRGGEAAGKISPDERPVGMTLKSEGDGDGEAEDGTADVGDGLAGEAHLADEAGAVLGAEGADEEAGGERQGDRGEFRLGVEPGDQRRGGGDQGGEQRAHGDIEPEQVALLGASQVLFLNGGGGEAEIPEQPGEAGDGHDHGHDPVVVRREQAGEDDRGRELDGDGNALGEQGDHATADGLALEIGEIDWRLRRCLLVLHGETRLRGNHGSTRQGRPRRSRPCLIRLLR